MDILEIIKATDLVLVEHSNHIFGSIRIVPLDTGEFLFNANDAAKMLEYKRTRNAIKVHVPNRMKVLLTNRNFGNPIPPKINNRGAHFITEEGIYRLITASKMPKSEEFKTWLFSELVPTIRNKYFKR